MVTFVGDPSIVGVVGALDSEAARAQIPFANAYGLVECSPGASNASLTRGPAAQLLNSVNPSKRAFVRVAATDDSQAQAMARWARDFLPKTGSIAVITDNTVDGKRLGTEFYVAISNLGGKAVMPMNVNVDSEAFRHVLDGIPTSEKLTAVFYGGTNPRTAAILRRIINASAWPDATLISTDSLDDNPFSGDSWYLGQSGEHGAQVTAIGRSIWTDFSGIEGFKSWIQNTTRQPEGTWSANVFACTQVILNAISKTSADGVPTREAVRGFVVNPANTVQTNLGLLSFDAQGDITQQVVTVYQPERGASPRYSWLPHLQYTLGLCVEGEPGPC